MRPIILPRGYPDDMIVPVTYPASYNYARIQKMFSLRQAGSVFHWPATPAESYFLIDAKSEQVLFVLPSGIQIFYSEYVVAPGDGIHFVKISENVVLQLPEHTDAKSHYRTLLEQLGLLIARTPEGDPVDLRKRSKSVRDQVVWCKEVRQLGPWFDFDFSNGLSEPHQNLIAYWADHADWGADDQKEVLKALSLI